MARAPGWKTAVARSRWSYVFAAAAAAVVTSTVAARPARARSPLINTHAVPVPPSGLVIDGMRFPGGSIVHVLDSSSSGSAAPPSVTGAILGAAAQFGGDRYEKGTQLEFFKPNQVAVARLAVAQRVHGHAFEANVVLQFDAKGRLASAGTPGFDSSIDGLKFKGSRQAVLFHPSTERLRCGWLAGDQRIGGLLIKGDNETWFHPDGTLERGELAAAQIVTGLRAAPGAIELFASGRPRKLILVNTQTVQGVRSAGPLELYDNGKVEYLQLAAEQRIEGLHLDCCATGDRVHFDQAGKPIGWAGARH